MTVSQSLFKGQKVIFPSNMRLEMTNIIHDSIFQGWNQAACAVPATYCFGRGMNKAVTNYSLACPLCELYRHANTKEPLLLYEVHARTCQDVSAGFFAFDTANISLQFDASSAHFETDYQTDLKSSTSAIKKLKFHFSRFDIPERPKFKN